MHDDNVAARAAARAFAAKVKLSLLGNQVNRPRREWGWGRARWRWTMRASSLTTLYLSIGGASESAIRTAWLSKTGRQESDLLL